MMCSSITTQFPFLSSCHDLVKHLGITLRSKLFQGVQIEHAQSFTDTCLSNPYSVLFDSCSLLLYESFLQNVRFLGMATNTAAQASQTLRVEGACRRQSTTLDLVIM